MPKLHQLLKRVSLLAEQSAASTSLPTQATKSTEVPTSGAEVGVSGTTVYTNRIHVEENSALKWEKAFGSPGATAWGEWEKLERTDHMVASALNLLAAPIRDAEVSIEISTYAGPSKESGGGDLGNEPTAAAGAEPEARSERPEYPRPDDDTDDEPSRPMGQAPQEVIAAFVKDCLTEWVEPGWPQLLEQIVRYGLGYGFSLHEIVWGTRPDDRVPGGVAVYPRKLAQRLPSSVKSDGWVTENGELKSIIQAGTRDGKWEDNVILPANKCILATWNRAGDNYQGFSAFRPGWYLAKIRAELLKILAIGHERESLGVPVMEVDKDATLSAAQIENLQEVLENIRFHENASLLLPAGVTMNWVFSPGANKGHVLETWDRLGLALLELVQAQQTALGTGGTGSRAVGEVHDATKNAFVNGIRAWIESAFNGVGSQPYTGLVKKIIDLNFGPQRKYPKFVLKIGGEGIGEAAVDQKAWVEAVASAKGAGAIVLTEKDEDFIRNKLGLPEVTPEERQALKAEDETQKQAQLEAFKGKENSLPDAEPDSKEPEMMMEGGAAGVQSPFVPRRALRPAERHLALTDIDNYFTSGRDQFEARLKGVVEDMVRSAREEVAEAMKDNDPSELKGLKLDTKLLGKALEVFIEEARSFGYRQARQEYIRQTSAVPPWEPSPPMAFAMGVLMKGQLALADHEDPTAPIDDDEVAKMVRSTRERTARGTLGRLDDEKVNQLVGAQTKLLTERIRNRTREMLWTEAIDAVRTGKNADAAVDAVLTKLESAKTLRQDAGIVLGRSFSMGRDQFIQQMKPLRLQVSAILDSATCMPCQREDGIEFEPNTTEHYLHQPPMSYCTGGQNCRCLLVPVYE